MLKVNVTASPAADDDDALTVSALCVPTIVPEALNPNLAMVSPLPNSGMVVVSAAPTSICVRVAPKFAPSPPAKLNVSVVIDETLTASERSPKVILTPLADISWAVNI